MVPVTGPSRISILTGAGLCKDGGFPDSVELASQLKATLTTNSKRATSSGLDLSISRDRAMSYLAAYHLLDGGIRFQRGILDSDPDVPINIEQIAMAADEVRSRFDSQLRPYISGWHDRIGQLEQASPDLFRSFLEFIYSQIEHWLKLDAIRLDKLRYIRNLVEVCHDDYCVDIFTLNYDLCIETALKEFADRSVVNGFTVDGGWQPSQFDRLESSIRLYKLHGSLDWVEDEEYGICSLAHPRHQLADDLEMMNLKPLLIFGTTHKLSPREPFLTLAHTFSQSVLRTEVLVVIGYSFGDDYVNQIIRQGVERNPKLRVIVVDPSAERIVRSQSFLKGRTPRVTTFDKTAKRALDDGDIVRSVRSVMRQVSGDDPFSEASG